MAQCENKQERGVLIGPLRRGHSADELAKGIFQLLNCVGIRCTDIARICVNPQGCYAKVVLYKKECEDYAVKVLREVRSVMSIYDLRRLTDKPKYLKVERIVPLELERQELSEFSEIMIRKEQERAQMKIVYNPLLEGETAVRGRQLCEDMPIHKVIREEVHDIRCLTRSFSSSETQIAFDFLEEEDTTQENVPGPVVQCKGDTRDCVDEETIVPGPSGQPTDDDPKPIMVDAKTSTPNIGLSFCTGRDFYHRLQLLTRDDNVHLDSGAIIKKDLRGFRFMIGKYVCAFFNTSGGTLFFGANDDGEVIGVPMTQRTEDALRLDIDNIIKIINPIVFPEFYSVGFIPVMDDTGYLVPDLKVIEIKVKPKPRTEPDIKYTFEHKVYYWRNQQLYPTP